MSQERVTDEASQKPDPEEGPGERVLVGIFLGAGIPWLVNEKLNLPWWGVIIAALVWLYVVANGISGAFELYYRYAAKLDKHDARDKANDRFAGCVVWTIGAVFFVIGGIGLWKMVSTTFSDEVSSGTRIIILLLAGILIALWRIASTRK